MVLFKNAEKNPAFFYDFQKPKNFFSKDNSHFCSMGHRSNK